MRGDSLDNEVTVHEPRCSSFNRELQQIRRSERYVQEVTKRSNSQRGAQQGMDGCASRVAEALHHALPRGKFRDRRAFVRIARLADERAGVHNFPV